MNKNTLVTLTVLAVLVVGTIGCASTRSAGEQFDDSTLNAKVKTKIAADPSLNPFEIDVDTKDREVRLSGVVKTAADRSEAERIARRTEGVTSVRNDITVGETTMGENISDAWIVTKIKTKLAADPEINPFNIDVDVSQGRVTLTGTVAKEEARAEAERHARDTDGVKDVRNLIEVKQS